MSTGCLGAIRKDGLHPSTKRGSTLRKQVTQPLEYGATMLLENLGGDILSNLEDPFGERLAGQIFAMGKIGLISPCPFKRMDMAYSNSYESVLRPDLPLSAGTVSSVLKSVGCDREGQLRFMRNYYSGTEYIIFDGTRLVSHSLGELGYNHCGIDDPQMNLQYCFSLKPERAPVYFL